MAHKAPQLLLGEDVRGVPESSTRTRTADVGQVGEAAQRASAHGV